MFDDDRLPTHLWVSAHIRQLNNDGIPAMVLQKGERNSGTLMLKLNMFENGCRVLTQMRDIDGRMGWLAAFKGEAVEEPEAEAHIARATGRDPDLWVIEIEDRQGRNPFEGKLL